MARAEREAAEAAVAVADAELTRLEDALRRRQTVGEAVLGREAIEDALQGVAAQQARADGARADAALARAHMERQRLKAPFDGVITRRSADPGDWVRMGDPLLTLVSADEAEVHARVPGAIAARLDTGDTIEVSGEPTSVLAVVAPLDPDTRTALVRARAPSRLLVGDAVDVSVPIEWTDRGVKIPRDALIVDPEQARLVRVVDGKAEVLSVEVLVSTETEALVQAEGLSEGDTVVIRGNERVRPGQAVRIEGSDGV